MINSNRFQLRRLTAKDATERYLKWLQSDVSKFICNRQASLDALVEYIDEQNNLDDVYLLGIFTKQGEHIGNVKFIVTNEHDGFSAEMGILIGESEWHGRGVAKEVIFAFSIFGRKQLNLNKVTLGVEKSNKPAVKAYLKMGFVPMDYAQYNCPNVEGIEMELLISNINDDPLVHEL